MNPLTKALKDGIYANQSQLKQQVDSDPWRLKYHQQPETGWMNDPNGVIQKDGLYHLYYQYSPLEPAGGLKYWGHKTSKDLVHFKEEEIFLYPDQKFDCHGVYSGSAFEKDGVIHFFYTGNVKHHGDEHDYVTSGREQNTVHMTSKDGFTIDSRNVVIDSADYPEGFTQHIRDPKIIEQDDKYYMVLGGRTDQDSGAILLYESSDLDNWEYKGTLFDGQEGMGYMWECPDFFELDEELILLMSPQGVEADEHEFVNVYQSGYYMGKTDWSALKFSKSSAFKELDRGFDFYAPQTFLDEKGRRILWGWMGLPDIETDYANPTTERGWQHAMTLPRELAIEDGLLRQRPLTEYQSLRKEETSIRIHANEQQTIPETSDAYEIFAEIEMPDKEWEIRFSQDGVIRYDGKLFSLEFGESGFGRKSRSIEVTEVKEIRMFADSSSVEIFLNDGEYVLSSRMYPTSQSRQISVTGNAALQLTKWDLKRAQ